MTADLDLADIAEIFPLYDLLRQSEWLCDFYGKDELWVYTWHSRAKLDVIEPYLLSWFNREEPAQKDRLFGEVRSVVEACDLPYPEPIERDLIRAMLSEVRRRRQPWMRWLTTRPSRPGHPVIRIYTYPMKRTWNAYQGAQHEVVDAAIAWCEEATRELCRIKRSQPL